MEDIFHWTQKIGSAFKPKLLTTVLVTTERKIRAYKGPIGTPRRIPTMKISRAALEISEVQVNGMQEMSRESEKNTAVG